MYFIIKEPELDFHSRISLVADEIFAHERCSDRVKVSSHDPFFYPIVFLALFKLMELLVHIINFFEIE